MAISYGATGITASLDTTSPFGATTYTLPASHQQYDLLIGFYGGKPYSTVPGTPSGYTAQSGGANGTTGSGAGTGSVYAVAFTKEHDGSEANFTSAFTAGYSPAICAAIWVRETERASGSWTVTSCKGSDATSTGTTYSATGDATLGYTVGDVVVVSLVHNDDSSSDSNFGLSIPGCTIQNLTQRLTGTLTTGTGNDGRMYVITAEIESGTASGAPTVTATTGNGDSDGQSVFLRLQRPVCTYNTTVTSTSATASLTTTASVVVPKVETLQDDFSGSLDTDKWNTQGTVTIVDGKASIPMVTGYSAIWTKRRYDALDSSAYAAVWPVAQPGNGTKESFFDVIHEATDSGFSMYMSGTDYLRFRVKVNGSSVYDPSPGTAYNATNHRYWRIREVSGTAYADVSADGSSWSNISSYTHGITDMTDTYVQFASGYTGTESADTMYVDNVNILGVTTHNVTVSLSATATSANLASGTVVDTGTATLSQATASLTVDATVPKDTDANTPFYGPVTQRIQAESYVPGESSGITVSGNDIVIDADTDFARYDADLTWATTVKVWGKRDGAGGSVYLLDYPDTAEYSVLYYANLTTDYELRTFSRAQGDLGTSWYLMRDPYNGATLNLDYIEASGTIQHPYITAALTADATVIPPKISTFVDDFNSDLSKWQYSAGCVVSQGVCTVTDYLWAYSYDLTASSVFAELSSFDPGGTSGWYVDLAVFDAPTSNFNAVVRRRASAPNDLSWWITEDGGSSNLADGTVTYSTTDHRFIRFRESSGTVYIERSPDGINWSSLGSAATTADLTNSVLSATEWGTTSLILEGINTRAPSATVTLPTGTATLTTAATVVDTATVTLPQGTAALTTAATVVDTATATLSGTASLTTTGTVVDTTTVTTSTTTAALTTTGVVVQSTTATLSSGGTGGPSPLPVQIEAASYWTPFSNAYVTAADVGMAVNITEGYSTYPQIPLSTNLTELVVRYKTNFDKTVTLDIRDESSTGTLIASFDLPNTPSWTTASLSITGLSGLHDIVLVQSEQYGNVDVDYLRFQEPSDARSDCSTDTTQPDGAVRIQAEDYDSQYGVYTVTSTDTGGGSDINLDSGGWALYNDVPLTTDLTEIRIRQQVNGDTRTRIEIRLGSSTGTLIGEFCPEWSGTGYRTMSARIAPQSGDTDLCFVYTRAAGWPNSNLNWFQFQVPRTVSAGDPTAALTVDAGISKDATQSLQATASLTTTALVVDAATVTGQTTASLTTTASVVDTATVSLAVAGSLTSTALVTDEGAGTLTGIAALTTSGTVVSARTVTLGTATAALTTDALVVDTATVTTQTTVALTTTATVVDTATVSLSATATLTIAALVTDVATAALDGTASLTTSGTVVDAATVTLPAATAALYSAGYVSLGGVTQTTTATAALITDAALTYSDTGTLASGVATLTSTPQADRYITTDTATTTASLTTSATPSRFGAVTLPSGTASLTTDALVTDEGTGVLTGTTDLTASGHTSSSRTVTLPTGGASLTTTGVRAAEATVSVTATASLTGDVTKDAVNSTALTATGSLTTEAVPGRNGDVTTTITGSLTTVPRTDAATTASLAATASVTTSQIVVDEDTVVLPDGVASLTTSGQVVSERTVALPTTTASLTTTGALSYAGVSSTLTTTAALTTDAVVAVEGTQTTTVTASLTVAGSINTSATCILPTTTASLTGDVLVTDEGVGLLTAVAGLTTAGHVDLVGASVSVTGTATLTPDAVRAPESAVDLAGTAALTTVGTEDQYATASLSVTASVTSTPVREVDTDTAPSTQADLTTDAVPVRTGDATLTSTAVLTNDASKTTSVTFTDTATAALTVDALVTDDSTGIVTATASLTTTALVVDESTATLTGTADLTTVGEVELGGFGGYWDYTGTLTADALVIDTDVTPTTTVTAALTSDGMQERYGTGTADTVTADLAVHAVVTDEADAVIPVTATLTTNALVSGGGGVYLPQVSGQMTVIPYVGMAGAASTTTVVASLTADAVVVDTDAVAITANATLTADTLKVADTDVVAGAVAALTATALVVDESAVDLSVGAGLTVTGVVTDTATVAVTSTAALTATGTTVGGAYTASVTATASLTADATAIHDATSTTTTTTALTSVGVVGVNGVATAYVVTSTITADATVVDTAHQSTTATASMTADGYVVRSVTVEVDATGTLTMTVTVTRPVFFWDGTQYVVVHQLWIKSVGGWTRPRELWKSTDDGWKKVYAR